MADADTADTDTLPPPTLAELEAWRAAMRAKAQAEAQREPVRRERTFKKFIKPVPWNAVGKERG